jgi:Tfp pilus assembly protein PilV
VVLPFHCVPRAGKRKLEWLRETLISILILVVSLAALIQFAAFTWRAAFLAVATAELPEDQAKYIIVHDLEEASVYANLCPELGVRVSTRLSSVSAYKSFLQFAISIGDSLLPSAAGWAQREMALCTRYATVTLSRRLERNQVVAAELSSF